MGILTQCQSVTGRQMDRQTDGFIAAMMHVAYADTCNKYVGDLTLPCLAHGEHVIVMSLHFNGHFPGGPGLAGARKSSFWILLELRMMEVVVKTGDISHAKLQSKCHQPTNQHPVSLQAGTKPNQQCQSTQGKMVSM